MARHRQRRILALIGPHLLCSWLAFLFHKRILKLGPIALWNTIRDSTAFFRPLSLGQVVLAKQPIHLSRRMMNQMKLPLERDHVKRAGHPTLHEISHGHDGQHLHE